MVVRAVHPDTRVKLFERLGIAEMISMRSFLDPPPTKGATVKGSGLVGYHLHKRNHFKQVVDEGSELHAQVYYDVFTKWIHIFVLRKFLMMCPVQLINYVYKYVYVFVHKYVYIYVYIYIYIYVLHSS
jgi:hypothetical protein